MTAINPQEQEVGTEGVKVAATVVLFPVRGLYCHLDAFFIENVNCLLNLSVIATDVQRADSE